MVSANLHLLPLFSLLFCDDDPPGGRALDDVAFIEEAEELPLNTTLLLSSDALMTRFSLAMTGQFFEGEKYNS